MAKLPDWTDLGGTPNVQPNGPRYVGRYDLSPLMRSAEDQARAGAFAGAEIASVGSAGAQVEQQKGLQQYTGAHAQLSAGLVNLHSEMQKDADYATAPERYGKKIADLVAENSASISNPAARQRFTALVAPMEAEARARVASHVRNLYNSDLNGHGDQQNSQQINQAVQANDENVQRLALDSVNSNIDLRVRAGALMPLAGYHAKVNAADQFATGVVQAAAESGDRARMQGTVDRLKQLGYSAFAPAAGVPGGLADAVKRFEGYRDKAYWDVKQHSIGYGTRATSPDETIDRATAETRLNDELGKAASIVDSVNPNLPAGVKAALTSLTFNAGDAWTKSELGDRVRFGDLAGAKERFMLYNKSDGVTNLGLVSRRAEEASWFDKGPPGDPVARFTDNKAGDGNIFDMLPAERRWTLINHLEGKLRGDRAAFGEQVKNTLTEATMSGDVKNPLTLQDFTQQYGAEGAKKYDEYTASLQAGRDVAGVAQLDPEQQQALLQSYAPVAGQANYAAQAARLDSVQSAIDRSNAEKKRDPANFAISRLPPAADAFSKMVTTFTNQQSSDADRSSAARKYAAITLAEQARVGIPEGVQQILPKSYVDNLQRRFASAADSDDPKARLKLLAGVQQEAAVWGEYWPKVMRQLAPDSQPIVRAIAAGANPYAMARLLQLPKGENPSAILKEQNETKYRDVTTELNNAMEPFMRTLMGNQRDRDYPGYYKLGEKLAAVYVRDGDSASAAAAKAFEHLIGERYDFRDTFRIPKSIGIAPEEIQRGTLVARSMIAGSGADQRGEIAFNIMPAVNDMPGVVDMKVYDELGYEVARDAWNRADSLKAFARDAAFVTSPSQDGLNLMYTARSGVTAAVKRVDGQPVLFSWKQLAELSKSIIPGERRPYHRALREHFASTPFERGVP